MLCLHGCIIVLAEIANGVPKDNSTGNYRVFHRLRVLLTCGSGPTMRKGSDLRKALTDFFFMLVKRKEGEEKGTSISGNQAATSVCLQRFLCHFSGLEGCPAKGILPIFFFFISFHCQTYQ